MSGMPAVTPPEVLSLVREQIKKELEMETMKSNILYQKQYQKFLTGETDTVTEGQTEKTKIVEPGPADDLMLAVKKAYSDAYALRAFREIMDNTGMAENGVKKIQQGTGTNIAETLIRSGVTPQAANEWLSKLSPQALGALIALQTGNPQLAQIGFAMGGSNGGGLTIKDVIELNQALKDKSPNMAIDFVKLIETMKQQPQGMTTKDAIDLITTGINMANQSRPQPSAEPREKEGLLEGLLRTPEGAKVAKEIGLIGNDTGTLTIVAEMRKNDQIFQKQQKDSDRNWDLRLEELKAKREIAMLKIAEGRERTQMISHSLQRIGQAVAESLAGGAGGVPEESADNTIAPTNAAQPLQFICDSCKAPITIPANAVPGQEVECPRCHVKYQTTAAPGPAK